MSFQSQAQKWVMHITVPLEFRKFSGLALHGAGTHIKEFGNSQILANGSMTETEDVSAFISVQEGRALELGEDSGVMALKVDQNVTLQCRPHKSSIRVYVAKIVDQSLRCTQRICSGSIEINSTWFTVLRRPGIVAARP